tara:strand:+ start:418 stop:831 length:414 start_codon:yes stop_codon:yes gene_type:complete
MESNTVKIPLTVAGIRAAIRQHHLSGVEWIEVGVRLNGDDQPTWNATEWLADDNGDLVQDLFELEPLRDVLRKLRAGYFKPVQLDLYCYRQNGRGACAELELLGNLDLNICAQGIVTIDEEGMGWDCHDTQSAEVVA